MCNSRCNCNHEDRCGCNGGGCENREWNNGCCNNEDFVWLKKKVHEMEERRRVEDRCIRQFRNCLRNCEYRNNY